MKRDWCRLARADQKEREIKAEYALPSHPFCDWPLDHAAGCECGKAK